MSIMNLGFESRTSQTVLDATIDGRWAGSVLISEWEDGFFAYRLFVEREHRGKGLATELMRHARAHADGKPVYLQPSAFADAPMDTSQLSVWYARLGFVDAGENIHSRFDLASGARMLRG